MRDNPCNLRLAKTVDWAPLIATHSAQEVASEKPHPYQITTKVTATMNMRNLSTKLMPRQSQRIDRGVTGSAVVLGVCIAALGCSSETPAATTVGSGGTINSTTAPTVGGATATSSGAGGSQASSSSGTTPAGGSNATSSAGGASAMTGTGGTVSGNGGSLQGGTSVGGTTIKTEPSTGGTANFGGAPSGGNSSKGGATAAGGKAAGGAGVGGANVGSGGKAAAGSNSGGTATGGASIGGSTTTSAAGSSTSPGCGAGKATSPCAKSGTTCSIKVNNKDRTYYLQLPANYDASKPYPVVFQYHPLTGTAEMALTMYKISSGMPDAIYITPQGLKKFEQFLNADATGWANTDGEDIQFTLDMLKAAQTDYCVDSARVFSVGFSYGGMMSYAIGCELGSVFRAIAPMAGATVSGCKLSGKPVAMWGAHGTSDSVVSLSQGQQARDKILKQNNCGTQTKPVDPSPCVEYQGCTSGYPVVWCEWAGDHATPSFAPSAIATFFKQF